MMEEAHGSLPPFIAKTYDMVEDPATDAIVSWSATSRSFIVWNQPEFCSSLLPKYFKHNNFSSFIRQLNTYGFKKIDPEKWEFANDDFIRGQHHLLRNIHRRKPVHSHSLQNVHGRGASPLTESERQVFQDEIEKLREEKAQLVRELARREQESKMYEVQLQCSNDRLEKLEKKQETMLSSVSQVLQKPGIALNLLQLAQDMDRKRRMPRSGLFSEDAGNDDPMETSLALPTLALPSINVDDASNLALNMERLDRLESSVEFWDNIAHDVGDTFVQSPSTLDFDESTSRADSPDISCVQLDIEVQPKSPEIGMNSEPAVAAIPDLDASKEQPVETAPAATGVNDVFWERFLTENPGSSETEEGNPERKDSDGRNNARFWWNIKNVNNVPEQMGHS